MAPTTCATVYAAGARPGESALRRVCEGHDRIEVSTRNGTERQDQRHQRRSGCERVGEQRDGDIPAGEPLAHDARTHDRHQEQGRPDELCNDRPHVVTPRLISAMRHITNSLRNNGATDYSCFRMTTAVDGHADLNSTDDCTDAGTSARAMRSNPNLGKNRSAVVVSRYTAGT